MAKVEASVRCPNFCFTILIYNACIYIYYCKVLYFRCRIFFSNFLEWKNITLNLFYVIFVYTFHEQNWKQSSNRSSINIPRELNKKYKDLCVYVIGEAVTNLGNHLKSAHSELVHVSWSCDPGSIPASAAVTWSSTPQLNDLVALPPVSVEDRCLHDLPDQRIPLPNGLKCL